MEIDKFQSSILEEMIFKKLECPILVTIYDENTYIIKKLAEYGAFSKFILTRSLNVKKCLSLKRVKSTAKVKMDVNKNTFWAGGFEFQRQKSTNVSRSVRKLADPYGIF